MQPHVGFSQKLHNVFGKIYKKQFKKTPDIVQKSEKVKKMLVKVKEFHLLRRFAVIYFVQGEYFLWGILYILAEG